jgi:hypothetical protein
MVKKLKYSELEKALAEMTAMFLDVKKQLDNEIKVKEFIAKKVDEL